MSTRACPAAALYKPKQQACVSTDLTPLHPSRKTSKKPKQQKQEHARPASLTATPASSLPDTSHHHTTMFSAGGKEGKDGHATSAGAAAGSTGGGDAVNSSSSSSSSSSSISTNAPTQPVRFRVARQRQPNLGMGDATHRGHHYSKEEQAKLASFQSIRYVCWPLC